VSCLVGGCGAGGAEGGAEGVAERAGMCVHTLRLSAGAGAGKRESGRAGSGHAALLTRTAGRGTVEHGPAPTPLPLHPPVWRTVAAPGSTRQRRYNTVGSSALCASPRPGHMLAARPVGKPGGAR